MTLTTSGIVTTVAIAVRLILAHYGVMDPPSWIEGALWIGLASSLGLGAFGMQRRVPRGDYAKKVGKVGLVVVLLLVFAFVGGCAGPFAKLGCTKVDHPNLGHVWDCRGKRFDWTTKDHPDGKPRPAGVVTFSLDGKPLPVLVTADRVNE